MGSGVLLVAAAVVAIMLVGRLKLLQEDGSTKAIKGKSGREGGREGERGGGGKERERKGERTT